MYKNVLIVCIIALFGVSVYAGICVSGLQKEIDTCQKSGIALQRKCDSFQAAANEKSVSVTVEINSGKKSGKKK